ncbi:hypothetical protein [Nonomuraea sp. NPDC049309]|uniref:hypothetical protein n=1 Tax=Nonomuraea sp. NPDC049309 TaxID=3364350 RepID=UPI00372141C8
MTGYVRAGYRVATRAERQDWWDAGLTVPRLVSLSDCMVELVASDAEGWDLWFDGLEEAERARRRAGPGWHVLGVGFAAADLPELLADMADDAMAAGDALPERLERREPFPGPGERRLGFEPVGYGDGIWHSWACIGGLVTDVARATGIRPGSGGLIDDEQQAHRAAQWLTASGLGEPKACFWTAALVTEPSTAG